MKITFFPVAGLFCLMFFYSGCSQSRPQKQAPAKPVPASDEKPMDFDQPWEQTQPKKSGQKSSQKKFDREFNEETDLDNLLGQEPIKMTKKMTDNPDITAAEQQSNVNDKKSKKKNKYRIQLLTVADIETAQAKKRKYSYLIGTNVEVYFDAPFYKLKFGHFTTKRKAEEKLLDLLDLGLSGFIIKE